MQVQDAFYIEAYPGESPALNVNPLTAEALGLCRKRRAYVSFGTGRYFVEIELSDTVPKDTLLLSRKVCDVLHLPGYIDYEIRVNENEILVGPCMGILAAREDKKITTGRLRRIHFFARYYSRLHGAIIVFSLSGVRQTERLVEGYCYNPKKDIWIRGVFPYPSAIYSRILLNEEWQNHFLDIIGDRVFNYRFNKWDMYRWYSKDADLAAFLPYTTLYRSYRDALDMLEKYGRIFVKPLSKAKGRGVVQLKLEGDFTVFSYREKGVNREISCKSTDEIKSCMKNLFKPRKYLVQQAVDLLRYKNSIVDFRCAMQKTQTGKWVCKTIVGRSGASGSVVSNVCAGGRGWEARELLKKAYSPDEAVVTALLKRIEALAITVCDALDQYGVRTGNLGLDIAVDSHGQLWIIEMNNRYPEPQIALDIENRELFNALRAEPLFYTKSLAGFGVKA